MCGKGFPFRENSLSEDLKERYNYFPRLYMIQLISVRRSVVQKGNKSELLNVYYSNISNLFYHFIKLNHIYLGYCLDSLAILLGVLQP